MKSEKGLMHLLIWVEAVTLILVVLLGIAKQITEPQEQVTVSTNMNENEIENLIPQTEASTQVQNGETQNQETQNQETQIEEMQEPVVFSEEVETMLSAMSLEEKVAQLFLVTPEVLTGTDRVTIAGRGTRSALTEYPVGGILYNRTNFMGQTQMRDLLAGAQTINKELTGRILFIGTFVEKDGKNLIVCAKDGQENALTALITAEMPLTEEIPADMGQILSIQNMEEYVQADEMLECCHVTNGGQTAVAALNAGVDMLYVADGLEQVYGAVLEAVNTGQISEETLRQAVGSILTEKQSLY